MSTAAQILANRQNATSSTGPCTESGKTRVSQNALKTGLFSKGCLVTSEEREDFESLREGLWESFSPRSTAEELIANEIVRAAWRLQRCALTEEKLWNVRHDGEAFMKNQIAIDRARVQATGVMNRNIEQLRKLQTDRWIRNETLPEDFDQSDAGIGSPKQVIAAVAAQRRLEPGEETSGDVQVLDRFFRHPEIPETKQTQSAPEHVGPTAWSAADGHVGLANCQRELDRFSKDAAGEIPETKQTQSAPDNQVNRFATSASASSALDGRSETCPTV